MAKRLADEPSPYLQQHKDNPVDWWPWGDAAFDEATRRDVPVFLSIGYSTCHWCHVMAHESFEDDDVAALLNEHFVPVKVDREERPDVDAAYMAVCQAMTGRGGWPLTAVLTPDRRPWFAGTYFPRTSRPGMPGMLDLLPRLHEAWKTQRDEVLHSIDHILEAVQRAPAKDGPQPSQEWSDRATASLKDRFDGAHGGFGDAPKFPSPHQLRFLLRQWRHTGDGDALHIVEHTLDAMAKGGIHDHLGGGFHRYSTDARWHLPHFEKMLYDQATLLLAYTEAYQTTGEERFRVVMEDITTYLLRDLRHPEGAFFAAEDADSEGEEGRFYVWTLDEVQAILGGDAARFATAYDVRSEGNFHDEVTRKPSGKNILHRLHPDAPDDLEAVAALQEDRQRLLHARSQRVRPHRDEKVLTDWNGLVITALAKAGAALGRSDWIQAASDAARFILGHMRPDGRLRHRFCDGVLDEDAFLDDHAFLAWGMLELFAASGDTAWLLEARTTTDSMLERFRLEDGALTLAPRDGERLVVETAEAYDGALPSGNSVAVQVLWRLSRITGEAAYEDAALDIARAFAATIERMPAAFTELLCGLQPLLAACMEVVVSGDGEVADAMLAAVRQGFHPDAVLIHRSADAAGLLEQAPWLTDYAPGEGGVRAYVCTDHACQAPVTKLEALQDSLA